MEPGHAHGSRQIAIGPDVSQIIARMITETAISTGPKKAIDWAKLRADFPILDQKVHGHPLDVFRQRRQQPETPRGDRRPRAITTSTTTPTCIAASMN